MMNVLFDLDNTLLDYFKAERKGARLFGEEFAREIPDYEEESFYPRWKDISRKEFSRFLAGEISNDDQRNNRIRHILGQPSLGDERAREYFERYKEFYEGAWEPYGDVKDALETLKARGVPMGVITDGSLNEQNRKLERMGIAGYFSFVLTAEGEGMAKPDPRFFHRALDRLGASGEKVLYVGDDLKKDATGATEAGLVGIWLNRTGSKGYFSRTIGSLSELETLV